LQNCIVCTMHHLISIKKNKKITCIRKTQVIQDTISWFQCCLVYLV
jgi:hypothetical protein